MKIATFNNCVNESVIQKVGQCDVVENSIFQPSLAVHRALTQSVVGAERI